MLWGAWKYWSMDRDRRMYDCAPAILPHASTLTYSLVEARRPTGVCVCVCMLGTNRLSSRQSSVSLLTNHMAQYMP